MPDVTLTPEERKRIFSKNRALFIRLSGYYISRSNADGTITYFNMTDRDVQVIEAYKEKS